MLTSTAIARSAATALADGGTAKDRAFLPGSPTRRFDAILHVVEIVLKDMPNADPATRIALGRLTETLARIVNLPAQPQESLKDFTRRLAAHMDVLTPSARVLIEKQLNQQSLLVALKLLIETLRPALSIELPADLSLPQSAPPDMEQAFEDDGPAFRQPTIQVPLPTRPLFSQAPGVAPGAPHLQQALEQAFSLEPPLETVQTDAPVRDSEEPLPTFREAAAFLASDAEALAQAVAIVRGEAGDGADPLPEDAGSLPGDAPPDGPAAADTDPLPEPLAASDDAPLPDEAEVDASPTPADPRAVASREDGAPNAARLPGPPGTDAEGLDLPESGPAFERNEPEPDAARSPPSETEHPLPADARGKAGRPVDQQRLMPPAQDAAHPASAEAADRERSPDRSGLPPARPGLPGPVPAAPSGLHTLAPLPLDPGSAHHPLDPDALLKTRATPLALAAESEPFFSEQSAPDEKPVIPAIAAALPAAGTMEIANTIAQLDEWETLFYMLAGNIAETPEPALPDETQMPLFQEEESLRTPAASSEPALDLLTLGEDEAREPGARLAMASDDPLPAGSLSRGAEALVLREPVGFAFVPYLPTDAHLADIDEEDGPRRKPDDAEEDQAGDRRQADEGDDRQPDHRETAVAVPADEDEDTESPDAYDLYQRLSDLP